MSCVHHWLVETPNGTPVVEAVCKKCGAEKPMRASCEFDLAPQGDWKVIKERTWEARLRSDKAKAPPKPRRPKRPMVHGTRYAYMRLKCRCEELPAERLNEGHVAVRFDQAESKRGEDWDTYRARTTGKHSAYGYRAYLNGVEVSNDCTEAVAGTDGWVVLFDSPRQLCATCHGVCSWVERGDVRLERAP